MGADFNHCNYYRHSDFVGPVILGGGSVAKLLNDRDDVVFFASGVSNSTHFNGSDIGRELFYLETAIEESNKMNFMFVYFSSIAVFTHTGNYVSHKKQMERKVKDEAKNYSIIRIGNIWECTNPNTFINAYKTKPYEPRDEYRYMISKEQLNFVTDNLPTAGKHEISIFGEMVTIKDALLKKLALPS